LNLQSSPIGLTIKALASIAVALITVYASGDLDKFWPVILTHETKGFECDEHFCLLKVRIRNVGWSTQHNLRVELPRFSKDYLSVYVSRAHRILGDASSGKTIAVDVLHPDWPVLVTVIYPKEVQSDPLFDASCSCLDIYTDQDQAQPARSREGPPDWSAWYVPAFIAALTFTVLTLISSILSKPSWDYWGRLHDLDRALMKYARVKAKVKKLREQIAEIPEDAVEEAEAAFDKMPSWMVPKSRRGSRRKVDRTARQLSLHVDG